MSLMKTFCHKLKRLAQDENIRAFLNHFSYSIWKQYDQGENIARIANAVSQLLVTVKELLVVPKLYKKTGSGAFIDISFQKPWKDARNFSQWLKSLPLLMKY